MVNTIKNDKLLKSKEAFDKSVKKELSSYLIKKAVSDGLIDEKTGNVIIKNIR